VQLRGKTSFVLLLVTALLVPSVAPAQSKSTIASGLLGKAQAGDPDGEFDVAYDYETGQGVPRDLATAAFWFRKAAEQGDARAQYNLALLYNTGQGVPQDYAEGYFWSEIAATGKVEGVKPEVVTQLRDRTASFLTKEVLLQTQERARAWFAAHQSEAAPLNPSSSGTLKGTDTDTNTSPASSSAQNPATQAWVRAETDQIRAMVQAIKQCPSKVTSGPASTILDGPPYNVTWDISASQSVRAPYAGYIELTAPTVVHCSAARRQSSPMGCDIVERPEFPLVLRYEYDLSPDGLSLSKILVRRDNETEWSNRPNVSNYCWERAAQPSASHPISSEATRAAAYRQECSNGDMQGCANLGTMYRMGWGVNKDLVQASDLFKKACDGGSRDGCKSLDLTQSR
jgi:hypothetical protein